MEQNSGARLNQPTAHLVTGGQREPGLRTPPTWSQVDRESRVCVCSSSSALVVH